MTAAETLSADAGADVRLTRELNAARAHIAALEQLLEVHEQTALEHAIRLEDTLAELMQSRQTIERRAAELLQLSSELARSNLELDQFAYVASHDLKAPLRGIANLSQWVEEDIGDRLSADSREHLRLLRGRVNRMEALINGILEYSRASRKREPVEPVDVGELLTEIIELLSPRDDVSIDVAAGMPVVEAERVPLQQVFMNLIGNAMKHAARAGGRIRIGVRPMEQEGFEFSVADNGPGIAPQFHDRVWQMFQTLAPRDKVEGTGIGLSVVKKIVEARGGRVWLESAEGAGATFYFSWPGGPREP